MTEHRPPSRPTMTPGEFAGTFGQADDRGLRCPRCGSRTFDVLRTERQLDVIVRRRECVHCRHRITTSEVIRRDF